MSKQADVIVIGAGVVGCSIALALSRRGYRTINVDSLPAAGYGSTSHSSAIVRPFYSHVTSCAVAHQARFHWRSWSHFLGHRDERGLATYTESGGLILVREGQESMYAQNLAVLDQVGVEYRLLDARALREHHPGICLDAFGPPLTRDDPAFGQPVAGRISGAIHIPEAGYVSDPQLAAHNLQAAAVANGAEFRFGAAVQEILRGEGAVRGVSLGDGSRLEAPLLVNAAGPHSAKVNELAGLAATMTISTAAHRHEVAYLSAPPAFATGSSGWVIDLDAGVYQRPDGADLLIGTADPDCDPPDVVDPDDYHTGFTEQWTTQVYRSAQRFPELAIENTARGTVGLYDVSDDWIPIYDKSDLGGYYLAIGTSGNQFKNAPLIGELMASIIGLEADGQDHDVRPATLELPDLAMSVDLSFFSRNRRPNETRSVLA